MKYVLTFICNSYTFLVLSVFRFFAHLRNGNGGERARVWQQRQKSLFVLALALY